MPAGCFKLKVTLDTPSRKTGAWCVEAPSATNIASTSWQPLKLQHVQPCSSTQQQCFQIEGDLKQGAMIMYQGMCVGVMSSPLPTGPSNTRDALRLMPCSEGYVYWKQDTPGGYLTITHSGCSAANPPAVCYVGMASRGPALSDKSVWVIDTRLSAMASSRVILTSGWASYTVVEEATGAY